MKKQNLDSPSQIVSAEKYRSMTKGRSLDLMTALAGQQEAAMRTIVAAIIRVAEEKEQYQKWAESIAGKEGDVEQALALPSEMKIDALTLAGDRLRAKADISVAIEMLVSALKEESSESGKSLSFSLLPVKPFSIFIKSYRTK